jgi:predicted exporter
MMDKVTKGWTINKEVSLGDLVAIVVALASVLGAYIAIDRRVTILETVQTQMATTDGRIERETGALRDEIRGDLKEIKTKLDTLTERSYRRP